MIRDDIITHEEALTQHVHQRHNVTQPSSETVYSEELTASEFLRSVSISESTSIHGESFPTMRVFQSRRSISKSKVTDICISC